MCTATWLSRNGSFQLFFNRDELRSRERAGGPGLHESEGVRFLAPRDGRAGGTWIAASELGSVFALLNRSEGLTPESPGSRGRLIPRLAMSASVDEFAARLLREPLRDLAPFRLVGFWSDSKSGAVATWDGEQIRFDTLAPAAGLLASSGLGDVRAAEERGRLWARRRGETPEWDFDAHRGFHRSHDPEPSAWSVCMHRDDAQTVSYTEVEIAASEVRLRYLEGAPCTGRPPVELRLPRLLPVSAR